MRTDITLLSLYIGGELFKRKSEIIFKTNFVKKAFILRKNVLLKAYKIIF